MATPTDGFKPRGWEPIYFPFTVLGDPEREGKYKFSFRPVGIAGMYETPPHQNQVCYGLDLRNYNTEIIRKNRQINLKWLLEMYKAYPYKEKFFDFNQGKFDKLAGT